MRNKQLRTYRGMLALAVRNANSFEQKAWRNILRAWNKMPDHVQKELMELGYVNHPTMLGILNRFGALMK